MKKYTLEEAQRIFAARAGKVKTKKKAAASRMNGKLFGGRPSKGGK